MVRCQCVRRRTDDCRYRKPSRRARRDCLARASYSLFARRPRALQLTKHSVTDLAFVETYVHRDCLRSTDALLGEMLPAGVMGRSAPMCCLRDADTHGFCCDSRHRLSPHRPTIEPQGVDMSGGERAEALSFRRALRAVFAFDCHRCRSHCSSNARFWNAFQCGVSKYLSYSSMVRPSACSRSRRHSRCCHDFEPPALMSFAFIIPNPDAPRYFTCRTTATQQQIVIESINSLRMYPVGRELFRRARALIRKAPRMDKPYFEFKEPTSLPSRQRHSRRNILRRAASKRIVTHQRRAMGLGLS